MRLNAGSVLVDTNILLRAIHRQNPLCMSSRNALKILHGRNGHLCVTPQNVREFWNVSTRSTDHNGLGISVLGTDRHTRFLERYFVVLSDSELTYRIWRELVARHQVLGVKVHDAYLVAAMKANGVQKILTFNPTDFGRYDGIEVMDPRALD